MNDQNSSRMRCHILNNSCRVHSHISQFERSKNSLPKSQCYITTLQDSKYVLKQIVSKNNKSRLRVFAPTSSFQVVLLCIKVQDENKPRRCKITCFYAYRKLRRIISEFYGKRNVKMFFCVTLVFGHVMRPSNFFYCEL